MKNKILVVSFALLCTGCKNNHPVDLAAKTNNGANQIATVKIERGSVKSVIKMPGQLKPFEVVDIYPKVNGFVKNMYVDRGSEVHTGQILMTLEAPEIDEQYEAAVGKLLQAQQTLEGSRDRYYRLKAASKTPGAVSELDLVNAQAKFQGDSAFEESEKANVSAVQALKDYLIVRAPFDGIITERNVHPGTLTGPNFKQEDKPLLNLQDDKRLRLEIFIPEEYSEKIDRSDKQVVFTTDALPGDTFKADIARSANSLNNEYRSEAIEADVFNKNDTFKPGMYVEAMLKVKSEVQSFVVPSSAIVTSTERKYVVAVQNGKAKFINISEGISSGGKTEVFGAFKGDENIVKNATDEIKEGDVVNG